MAEAEWRRIDSLVRPQRYALLINHTDYWQHTCQRAIEVFTQLWGGSGFILIPTNGRTISEKYWDILERYSPDYIGSYKTTLRDLKWASPYRYASTIEELRDRLTSQGIGPESANEHISEQEIHININELRLSDSLKRELLTRLSPFHFAQTIDRHNIYAGSRLDYPFTRVGHIARHSKTKLSKVYKQKELSQPVFNLMAKMRTGSLCEQLCTELEAINIEVSNQLENLTDKDYLDVLERGEANRLTRLTLDMDENIAEDFLASMPNALSNVGLGKYFKILPNVSEKEYVTVVIGDQLEDFCFAFSLTKMLNNVHWMPDKPLRDVHRLVENARRTEAVNAELQEGNDDVSIVRNLASNYVRKIGYGHHNHQKIIFTSVSLTKRQLTDRRNKILSLAYVGLNDPRASTIIRSPDEIDLTSTSKLLETNNYANDQAIAFVSQVGVERIRPIKPKNFNYIDAQHHRWIQTIVVEGFQPPPLPSLGIEIFNNHSAKYEVRAGRDGLSYLLPGISYFSGNDIDTTLSRPQIKMLTSTEMFAHYFAGHYLVMPSDKGKYFDDTVKKFGTLDIAAKFFSNRNYNKLLDQFTEAQRSDENRRRSERIFLEYSSRAYMDIRAVQKALGRGSSAGNVINHLLSIKVLRRGLILRCINCACSAWYDNDNIGQEFECVRCRSRQLILKDNWKIPDEPNWYYALAETVHQFYKSNSHITLLALRYIKSNSSNFYYLPEVELREVNESGRKIEIDIACIKDGEIYLGEAKNRKLAGADLTKYIDIYNILTPKPHRIVFASNYRVVPQSVRARVKASSIKSKTKFILHKDLYAYAG